MEQISVMKLDKNSSKPVFELENHDGVFPIWFISIWVKELESFKSCTPYRNIGTCVKHTGYQYLLGGFGKGVSKTDMYIIPEFTMGNLIFKNFNVAVLDKRRFAWDLILSYTVFTKIDYSILNRNQDTPLLRIVADKECYYMGVHHYHLKDGHYVDKLFLLLRITR